jgi:hypothetical protein
MQDFSETYSSNMISLPAAKKTSQEKWFFYLPFFVLYFSYAVYFYFSTVKPYLASRDYYGPRLLADSITYESICVIGRDLLDYATLRDIGPCLGLWTFSYNSGLLSFVNVALIIWSVVWMAKTYDRPWQPMLCLVLINPITFCSMFAANKEVYGFTSFAMLVIFVRSRSYIALIACLVTALFTRIPALVTTGTFCILLVTALPRTGDVLGKNKKRYISYILALIISTSLIAAVYGQSLQDNLLGDFSRAEDVSRSTELSLSLNSISSIGLYPFVYIVRLLLNFYSGIMGFLNLLHGEGRNYYTVAVSSSSVIFITLTFLIIRRGIPKDLSKTADAWNIMLFAIFMTSLLCLSPVIQHRYFFPVYALLVLFTIPSRGGLVR